MRSKPLSIPFCTGLLLGFGIAFGQAPAGLRCDLKLRATPGVGRPQSCLDLSALENGESLRTGGNVTRISAQGLKFCPDPFKVTTGGSADIVFIVDNSGSMWSTRAFVKGADTVFINDGVCGVGTTGGTLTYPVWDDKSSPNPAKSVRTVGVLQSDPGSGCEFAGDPYNTRSYVVRKAIDFLAANSPKSAAGVIGFAAATMHEQGLLPLDQAASVTKVKASMVPDSAFGTNYGIALDTASKWLTDSTRMRNAKQAIVLISDGRPGWGFELAKDSTRFPVYGIYLGKKSTPDTAILKGLSDKTGGSFFRVDPGNSGSLLAVMDSILKKITATAVPKRLTMGNGSLNPPQTSVAGQMALDSQGNLSVDLDSILGLNRGPNAIRFSITLADGTDKEYALNIQADGAEAAQSGADLECHPQAALAMLNVQGVPDTLYPAGPGSYTYRLTRSLADGGPVQISATTRDSSGTLNALDSEAIPLADAGPMPNMHAFAAPYPFHGLSPVQSAGNGTLEAVAGGWVDLAWHFPRDSREAASYSLRGSNMKVTLPPTADPPSRSFTTLDPDLSVALLPGEPGAVIHYTLDGSLPGLGSPVYSSPIPVARGMTIKAMDVKPGQAPSPVAVFSYTRNPVPKTATPVADPPGAGKAFFTFAKAPQAVTFSDATPGATIWYSLDGSAFVPATGCAVPGSASLRLFATRQGMYPSDTALIHFEYDGPTQIYVRFPDGGREPARGASVNDLPGQGFAFIPVDRHGEPLPGDRDGKCGPRCAARNGPSPEPFAGPIIHLEIPGPCSYALSIYTNHGGFVAKAEGRFTAEDLAQFDPSADGTKRVGRVVWTGRARDGSLAASGAYVLRAVLANLGGAGSGAAMPPRATITLFGLIRNP